MKRCLQEAHVREWMTNGKITLIQKEFKQKNRSKQLQTKNLLTDDVENINSTNKGRDLILANKPRSRKDTAKDTEELPNYFT